MIQKSDSEIRSFLEVFEGAESDGGDEKPQTPVQML